MQSTDLIASTSNLTLLTSTTTTTTTTSTISKTTTTSIPIPSFQDIDSETDSDDPHNNGSDDEDWDKIVALAEAAFTDEEVDFMQEFLKERGLFAFVKRFIEEQKIPIQKLLLLFGILVPEHMTNPQDHLRLLKIACSRVLRNRERLEQYSTVEDAINLIAKSKKILVLTGAGVSTSCGIPDFRSPTGLYARLKEENWELEDPQQMFDLDFFKEKPNIFYSFAKEIYPSNFVPSPCHRFVKLLENNDHLLRNYTQNIDGLFESAGVQKMLNCHGSFATASCLRCKTQFPGSAIKEDVFAQRVPLCPICTATDKAQEELNALLPKPKVKKVSETWNNLNDSEDDGDDGMDKSEWDGKPLIKPDIVFFGEMLSDEFDRKLLEDREEVDLLIVMGTSLRVSPVAQITSHLPHSIPQILINRDPITHVNFDIHLLGDGDTIVKYLCSKLPPSFDLSSIKLENDPPSNSKTDQELQEEEERINKIIPERVGESNVWTFPGANGGKWVERIRESYNDETEEEDNSNQSGEGGGGLEVPESESRSRSRSEAGSDDEEQEEGLSKKIKVM